MTDQVVTRLYRALVEELRRRGHPEDRPVKVSELYQTLVPYRAVRSRLGVELNADYEHALLRLLAGERDLLRLEPADYREELHREVEATYPFVGLFRKFSAADVWVTMPAADDEPDAATDPESVDRGVEPPQPAEPRQPAGPGGPTTPAASTSAPGARIRSGGGPEPAPARPPVHLHPAAEPGPAERPGASERLTHGAKDCAFCGDPLPPGRRVRFCPHCGGDQRLRPCPRCEAVLERDWRYCISCGEELGAG